MKQDKIFKIMLAAFVLLAIPLSAFAAILPTNPLINYNYSETVAPKPQAYLNTTGGSFTTLVLNATQQNYRWKAYVGNVTGTLALEDQTNYTIYNWESSTISGNVYVSRNDSIEWSNLTCANKTIIESEDSYLNLNSSKTDSINMTFANSTHKRFYAANNLVSNSTCPAIATYVNGTSQSSGEENSFQEILLKDTESSLIYTTILEGAIQGFDNNYYDFQMIVAEDEAAASATKYYFYVELI